jgi:hypothetical protein
LPQDAALDELRLKDLPIDGQISPGTRIDPLVHYAGRVDVNFVAGAASTKIKDLKGLIDHAAQTVKSSTGELALNYREGVLTINADHAQGVSGCLARAGHVELKDVSIASDMELGHIIAVSLDGRPLGVSSQILLQVMSEEKATDFQTEPGSNGVKRIINIGRDPWLVRKFSGTLRLKRPDAAGLKLTALDFNGYPVEVIGSCREVKVLPATMYYLIAP